MKPLKSNKKHYFLMLVLGFSICFTMFIGFGVAAYKMSGQDMQDKMGYVFKKGAEKIKIYSQNKISVTKEKMTTLARVDEKFGDLSFNIKLGKPISEISPLIYGSNLTAKTEFEMDVAKFGKEIGITNVRFPGGESAGYRWKLAKFDFNDRYDEAPLANIENVIKFCRIMDTKLVIQVNIESGTPEEAAEWVQYMNKGLGNFRVDYWEIGNEAYGDWDRAHMSGDDYAKLVKEYSAVMKRVDPMIKIGASLGGERFQAFDEGVMKGAADYIDFVSYHWYPNHINKTHKYKGRIHPLPEEIMANGLAVGKLVSRFENMVMKYAPHQQGKIEFTVMEWDGSWDAVPSDLEFEYKGIMWSLANAIFYADALGQFALNGITVANHYDFQEVMFGLIRGWDKQAGWGGSRWDGETIRPKALALKLFARYFEDILVESSLTGSSFYYKELDWRPDSFVGEVPYVTGYASVSEEGDVLAIALINKHAEQDFVVNISVEGGVLASNGEVRILTGPSLEAQNDASPGVVDITKYNLTEVKNKFRYTVPARSVNMLRMSIETPSLP